MRQNHTASGLENSAAVACDILRQCAVHSQTETLIAMQSTWTRTSPEAEASAESLQKLTGFTEHAD